MVVDTETLLPTAASCQPVQKYWLSALRGVVGCSHRLYCWTNSTPEGSCLKLLGKIMPSCMSCFSQESRHPKYSNARSTGKLWPCVLVLASALLLKALSLSYLRSSAVVISNLLLSLLWYLQAVNPLYYLCLNLLCISLLKLHGRASLPTLREKGLVSGWSHCSSKSKLLTSSCSFCMCSITVFWFSFIRFKINIAFHTNDLILTKALPWRLSKFSSFFISLWNGYSLSSFKERK